jgi:RND family efflux transporter MFP subunit
MKKNKKYLIAALLVLAAGLAAWHFSGRGAGVATQSVDEAIPVSVARAQRGNLTKTVRLTAEFRAYQEIDVHAKVAGFIQSIPVDIGDQVKEGGLLATLEIPELDQDLKKAAAGVEAARDEVNKAEAGYQETHEVFTRLQTVATEHPKLVAQQDIDDARAKDQAASAALESAKRQVEEAQAEQSREMALVDYSKIVAPFDGVVTKRYADTGAFIQAGTSSSTEGTAVVRFAQEKVLRVMFPVPESAVASVKEGVPVRIEISGLDRTLQGIVTRFSKQLDPETRTMETEVDIPNPGLGITPGMYGWADLTLDEHKNVLSIPVEAISSGEDPTVYLIGKDNKIEERPVKIGLQTPNRVEIVSGLADGDCIFIGNRSRVRPGELVKPQVIETAQIAFADK